MSSDPGYPAARRLAPLLEEHFARHRAAGLSVPGPATAVPRAAVIERIIDAAFWASLRREEGYVPKISIALVPLETARHALVFERPIPLSSSALVRIAPAVERAGIHLGVSGESDALQIWGTTRATPPYAFVLEVAAPGLLVVKHQRGDSAKFVNVAVLEGDEVKVIDENAANLADCPSLLRSLLGLEAPDAWSDPVNLLIRLAVSMRAHGRGGSLLVVPAGTEAWRDSIVQPIAYQVAPPFAELTRLIARVADDHPTKWQEALTDTVNALGGLTAVDGATVITDRYELLAFGAKIARRPGSPRVEMVTVTEPIQGSRAETIHASGLGGTRHLSAAQFVHDQRDGVALVASQDRAFTMFGWSPREGMVHAHRVETLLL